ncbi:toll/interleukin-1 receptor domain-containing protein [uncultured Caulobacter sp.]|uniref:toll/interleukin-1 receptor domain-containing protein n=1 Tax=uncultured Caulobacter sp. TaxID=158749 RepID=UPI002629E02C|nr:toll/interleukin-1 receptor domain-containing protein [uncultured Caulobacter sp.]
MTSRQRYRAFISYSHRDRKIAEWLHRALETYRAPRDLASAAGGASTHTLRPIFRDRDELSASGNLNQAIRDALDQSDAMIVLCSPASVASRWVDQEVAYFVNAGGAERVICVIAPETDARTPLAEVLPPSLRAALPPGVEPLAVDLRRDADGKRLARLKIAARLLGVNLDRLVQRDARRRVRLMTAFTAAALLIAAGMGAMTVETLKSRQIARQQRDETEALVAYMLGDLREQLEPVGRLDVLDGVGARVLAYYAKPRTDRLDDKALAQRAKAQTLLGTIREQRGDLAGAQAAFGQAAATTQALVERDPRNGERIFDEAQNVFWLGYVEWRRGDVAAAERRFKRYEALALQLVKLDANRADWRVEVAYANNNLGTLLFEQGRPEEAVAAFRRALAVFEAEVARAPTKKNVTGAANSRAWLADALVRQGRMRDALVERETVSTVLARASAQAPDDKRLLARALGAELALARLERDLGRKAASQTRFEAAQRRLDDLTKLDPTNARWREYLVGAQIDQADRLAWAGQAGAARARQAAAVAALAKLRASGDSKVWTPDLDGRTLRESIILAQLSGDQVQARRLAESLLAKLKTLESDHEGAADRSALRGFAQLAAGDPQGAIATLEPRRRALAPAGLDTLARAYLASGQRDRAGELVTGLRKDGYANPAFLEFWRDSPPGGATSREVNQ